MRKAEAETCQGKHLVGLGGETLGSWGTGRSYWSKHIRALHFSSLIIYFLLQDSSTALKSFIFLLSQFFTHKEWPFSMFRNVELCLCLFSYLFTWLQQALVVCRIQDLRSLLQHAGSVVTACKVLIVACGV